MINEYAMRPQKLVVATAASVTATITANANSLGNINGPVRKLYATSTADKAIALTIQYPGEAIQDWIEIPGTTTAVTVVLNMGACGIRLGGMMPNNAQVASVTIGAYNTTGAPTTGRVTLSFM